MSQRARRHHRAGWLAWSALLAVACATGGPSTTEEPEGSGGATGASGSTSAGAAGAAVGGSASGGTTTSGSGGTTTSGSGGTTTSGSGGTTSSGSGGTTTSGSGGTTTSGSGGTTTSGSGGISSAGTAGAAGDGGSAGGPTSCAGKVVGGFCWYYAATAAQSCGDVCKTHGGYHTATRDFAGSGGTDTNCLDVLDAVGAPGSNVSALIGSGAAVGCFYSPTLSQRHRVPDTPTSQNATYDIITARRVCACNG